MCEAAGGLLGTVCVRQQVGCWGRCVCEAAGGLLGTVCEAAGGLLGTVCV